jgi:hypothetical protein
MLADGFAITEFWGPEQMDVWQLKLTRGPVTATFGIERGFPYGIEIAHRDSRYATAGFGLVRYVWARRTGVALHVDSPDDLPTIATTDEWRPVIDWLAETPPGVVDAIDRVSKAIGEWWVANRTGHGQRMTPAEGLRLIEDAALG